MKLAKAFLWLIIPSLLFALATDLYVLWRLLYAVILALALAFVWSWLNLRWLQVEVERRTTMAKVGGEIVERITVRNTGHLPKAWLEVEDLTNIPGHHPGAAVSLPPKAFRSWRSATLCEQRGVFLQGPLVVATGDPLGLFRLERRFPGIHQVVVYPATVELPGLELPPADLPGDGRSGRRSLSVTPRASSVREYLAGDSLSRIHWPTTARQGRLMVKEFDLGPEGFVWIVLDMEGRVQVGQGKEGTEEYAVTIAASIAAKYLDRQRPVGLVAYGDRRYFMPPTTGEQHRERLMHTLAVMRAEGSMPLARVLYEEERSFGRYETLVVISPSRPGEWASALAHVAGAAGRVTAVWLDAASFGGAPQQAQGSVWRGDDAGGEIGHLGLPSFAVRRGPDMASAIATAFNHGGYAGPIAVATGDGERKLAP